MWMTFGNGGWREVIGVPAVPGRLYVRATEVDGVQRITELYIDGGGEPIPAVALRKLPLSVLEEWSEPTATDGVPGPDLSRLASYFSTRWNKGNVADDGCPTCKGPVKSRPRADGSPRAINDWVEMSWLAQHDGDDQKPLVPRPRYRERSRSYDGEEAGPLPVLEAPTEGLTDEFLTDVATAYKAAIAHQMPPAQKLAELAHVQVKTVNSWCLKARKRGLMDPAKRKGRIV